MAGRKIFFDFIPTSTHGGRPKQILNDDGYDEVVNLSKIGCTDEEIAAMMDTTVDLLLNKNNKSRFLEAKKKGYSKGRASLRRMQFKAANQGNVAMQIFLGKQILNQSDNPTPQVSEVKQEDDPLTLAVKKSIAQGEIGSDGQTHGLQLPEIERAEEDKSE